MFKSLVLSLLKTDFCLFPDILGSNAILNVTLKSVDVNTSISNLMVMTNISNIMVKPNHTEGEYYRNKSLESSNGRFSST